MEKVNKLCPNCGSNRLPKDKQPEAGTHAFSVKYRCGGQIVVVIGQNYWEWEDECTVEVLDDGK